MTCARSPAVRRTHPAFSGGLNQFAGGTRYRAWVDAELRRAAQAATGLGHLGKILEVLKDYPFEEKQGTTLIVREPIGVCGFITPWNWPVNQIMCKVAPALAAGCTIVLKPTEIAPLNAMILAEIFHEAGLPRGVFNLVNGDGPTVGQWPHQ